MSQCDCERCEESRRRHTDKTELVDVLLAACIAAREKLELLSCHSRTGHVTERQLDDAIALAVGHNGWLGREPVNTGRHFPGPVPNRIPLD